MVMACCAWPILTCVLDEEKLSTVLPQNCRGRYQCIQEYCSKRDKLSHSAGKRISVFFSIIDAIRSHFPLALSSMHTYRYSAPVPSVGFGYEPLLSLFPHNLSFPLWSPAARLWLTAVTPLHSALVSVAQSHSAEELSTLMHGPESYHPVTAQYYQNRIFCG